MKRVFIYDLSRCERVGSDDLLCLRSGVGPFLLSEILKHRTETGRISHSPEESRRESNGS